MALCRVSSLAALAITSGNVFARGGNPKQRQHLPATSPPAQKARPTPLPTTKPQSEDSFHSLGYCFSTRNGCERDLTHLNLGFEQSQHGCVKSIELLWPIQDVGANRAIRLKQHGSLYEAILSLE